VLHYWGNSRRTNGSTYYQDTWWGSVGVEREKYQDLPKNSSHTNVWILATSKTNSQADHEKTSRSANDSDGLL